MLFDSILFHVCGLRSSNTLSDTCLPVQLYCNFNMDI